MPGSGCAISRRWPVRPALPVLARLTRIRRASLCRPAKRAMAVPHVIGPPEGVFVAGDLTHVDVKGEARMVDVSAKEVTRREAEAAARVELSPDAVTALGQNRLQKGDAFAVARLAGIQAAKRTAEWIPLCHSIGLDQVKVALELDEKHPGVNIHATVRARAVTGVEMEALVAVSAAALALYDMVKAIDREALIGPIGVVRKTGGRRGTFRRDWPAARLVPPGSQC